MQEIKDLSSKIVFLQIDLQPAVKKLSSGRNAHIMLAPSDWWISQVSSIFPIQGSYPIFHANGEIQKVAVVAAKNCKYSTLVWSFLMKLQKHPMAIQGGYLGGSLAKKRSY